MPGGLDKRLSETEIADLVAYLKEAKGPAVSAVDGAIPPHTAISPPGLHAYAQKSISAGEEIEFRVSSTVPYELSVVRLGEDPDDREGDPVLKSFQVKNPEGQSIHPGSYLHVAKGIPHERRLSQLTLEGWIRPFTLSGWQGLITQHDYPQRSGIGLFMNGDRLVFITADGGEFEERAMLQTGPALSGDWQHVAATWDGKTKRIYVNGKMVASSPFVGVVRAGRAPLRLGAYGSKGVASSFYNGDLAMFAIHEVALDADQIAARVVGRGQTRAKGKHLLGCWPFAEERGTRVADTGPHGRTGRIINQGTWMIGGPGFDAGSVGRHDTKYDPTQDDLRGHGLRLADDELYNARWKVTHRYRIPADAKSGVYAGRFDFKSDGKTRRYYCTFIVRRPDSRAKAPVLVLVSSNTWLAYNAVPFPVNHGRGFVNMSTNGLATSHAEAPGYSFYRDHRNGQPAYKVGLKVPWPAAGPNKTYLGESYSHLLRGERFLHLWLDKHGYEYDVITDHDLDRNPEVLKGYQTFCINGHSEYWSARAYEGLDRYLKEGGSAVVLSGNTMFWRVSFDESGEVMECRKFGTQIGGRKHAKVGELYHSHDFKRGSLMRFCGYPAWSVIGLTCSGWSGNNFKPYQADLPDHFLFQKPHRIELKKGQAFGFVSDQVGAVGHEYDVRLPTLLAATPNPAVKGLKEPAGIVTLASSHDKRAILDFNAVGHKARAGNNTTIAEMIYWERPQGGRVFHAGSIATAWGMYHDQPLSRLVQNVLHHFGVKPK